MLAPGLPSLPLYASLHEGESSSSVACTSISRKVACSVVLSVIGLALHSTPCLICPMSVIYLPAVCADAACVQLWSQILVSSPSQSLQQLLTSSAHSHQQPRNAHSSAAARSSVQIRCQQTSRKMNFLQPSIQSKLQQAAASLQTGLEDHRHRLCRTIQHAAEVAAALDQQLGLEGQRRRVNRALVRGLQRLTAAVQGGQWHHRHGSQGSTLR